MSAFEFPEFEFRSLEGRLYRIVESQEEVATREIVSDLAKQELIEQLLDKHSKPAPAIYPPRRHYLLSTPFRYPPLKYGSRFGDRSQPSLFYASLEESTVLAECAYYRFVFWQNMDPPPKKPVELRHTLFWARFGSDRGVDLVQAPFEQQQEFIAHRSDYRYTQALGSYLRECETECFVYPSARDPRRGRNLGVFKPSVLVSEAPEGMSGWVSRTDAETVEFFSIRERKRESFGIGVFVGEDGVLPKPA